ncbi:MAG: HD domain-containing protein [Lachnospiraceae bacterium]|nr:HD domain-containing protein [Lachnospiraceae bacterium]
MKDKKGYVVAIITVLAVMVNLFGRILATKLSLPVWLDSFGTLLMAYASGPVCGGIVGMTSNVIYGIFVEQQTIYCVVGALIGVVTGVAAKKKVFETLFQVMTLGMGLSLLCTIAAIPINLFLYDGEIGNLWGDQMIHMCVNGGIPSRIACIIGQFYIEFLDKLVCAYGIYVIIKGYRYFTKKNKSAKHKKRMMKHHVALMLAIAVGFGTCLYSAPVYAQKSNEKSMAEDYNTYTQTTYGSEEGLLAGEANDIVQTKDGRIWIGTYAGLYSYDGIKFKHYNDIDSIKNVNALYVDEEGRLWIGTNDTGFTIMIGSHVMNVVDEEDGLPSNVVRSVVCDSNGNYYIGSADGLALVTLSGGVKVQKVFEQIKNVTCLTADGNGNVVAITDNGEPYFIHNGSISDNPIQNISDHRVRSAFFTQNGTLYLGTDQNLVLTFSVEGAVKRGEDICCEGLQNINSFYETEEGEIFVCSDIGAGYLKSDGEFCQINMNHFTSSIDHMIVDYQGNLWFASSRLGLLKLCKSAFAEVFPEVQLEEHVVNTVTRWNGLLFCGTDDGLIMIDEDQKQTVTNEISDCLDTIRIRHITPDSKGNLWIATAGAGVFKISIAGDIYEIINISETDGMPGKRFRNIMEAQDGSIVVAGDEGIAFIRDNRVEQTLTGADGLMNIKSLCLLEHDGSIYAGSDGGGIAIIKDGMVRKVIDREDGLSSGVIMRMVYDEITNGIFVVTSNGLCYLADDGTVSALNKFPYSNNYDIVCGSDGAVWILGSAGIYVANVEELIENQEGDYELLNARRGLLSSLTANSWNYLENGDLYLCCDRGVVKVNMDAYDISAKSYRMILNYAKVDGVACEIKRTEPLILGSDVQMVEFEPEILNYSLNDPYISFTLEGDKSGTHTMPLSALDTISYSNLEPGNYTLKISVLDGRGGNVLETSSYTIVKEIEMYQRWWFKVYVIVIAALVIVWITWFVTRSQVQKTVLKQKLELEYAKKQLEMGNETILSIARTVDAKDTNTSEHSFRVSQYSVAIAKRYGFDEKQCENLRQMALLHDIGKIGIPDAILNKPAKLTDEEYEIMKSHVVRGGEILKDFSLIENVNVGALYHHERYDGKGYCAGLKGEEIPIEARIIGIADAFDAMTANRVYRKQLDLDYVIEELKRCSGTQFDPNLTKILLSLIDDREFDVETLYAKSKEEK